MYYIIACAIVKLDDPVTVKRLQLGGKPMIMIPIFGVCPSAWPQMTLPAMSPQGQQPPQLPLLQLEFKISKIGSMPQAKRNHNGSEVCT